MSAKPAPSEGYIKDNVIELLRTANTPLTNVAAKVIEDLTYELNSLQNTLHEEGFIETQARKLGHLSLDIIGSSEELIRAYRTMALSKQIADAQAKEIAHLKSQLREANAQAVVTEAMSKNN